MIAKCSFSQMCKLQDISNNTQHIVSCCRLRHQMHSHRPRLYGAKIIWYLCRLKLCSLDNEFRGFSILILQLYVLYQSSLMEIWSRWEENPRWSLPRRSHLSFSSRSIKKSDFSLGAALSLCLPVVFLMAMFFPKNMRICFRVLCSKSREK